MNHHAYGQSIPSTTATYIFSLLFFYKFLYFLFGTACPLTPVDGMDAALANGVRIAYLDGTEAVTFI